MLNNQDFAQSDPKSPVKRRLQLVSTGQRSADVVTLFSDFNKATRLLQETIVKIDGAYAPSTIRAYRADFNDFLHFCHERNANALPAQPNLVAQYICELTGSGRLLQAFGEPCVGSLLFKTKSI
ncbi:site-specific integrase [Polynucleobacter necessarius]|uniref:site-specific integrase n=1 Tax=Polynucleobacter necessarius TaxID=576610 RepID=UPI000E0928F8|nr:site-specific integrase [Polynucleobacter necessarius]